MDRLQLSIGEWLHDHEDTILVFFRSWSRYLVSRIFLCLSINFKQTLLAFFVSFFFFPNEIAFSRILRIKTIFFGSHSTAFVFSLLFTALYSH